MIIEGGVANSYNDHETVLERLFQANLPILGYVLLEISTYKHGKLIFLEML